MGRALAERLAPRPGSGFVRIAHNADWTAWQRGRFRVLSSLSEMELPGGGGRLGPTWLVSISRRGIRRASVQECRQILRDFAMPRPYDEDNHQPGRIRAFFCPVDPAFRTACECKSDEVVIVEADGFRWTNPVGADVDRSLCRGCEWERRMGWPCPVHSRERVSP